MGVGSGLYMYDAVVKRSRSLSHLLMSSCTQHMIQNYADEASIPHINSDAPAT